MAVGTSQIAAAEKDQRSDLPGEIEQAGSLKSFDAHKESVPDTLVDVEFAPLFEFFLLALVPLLNGPEKTAHPGIDFRFAVAPCRHEIPPCSHFLLSCESIMS
jgi:hypothetical protein